MTTLISLKKIIQVIFLYYAVYLASITQWLLEPTSHSTVRTMQEGTGFPSISTVQEPQAPLSHPIFVPVRPSVSLNVWASVWEGATARTFSPTVKSKGSPLMFSVIVSILSFVQNSRGLILVSVNTSALL